MAYDNQIEQGGEWQQWEEFDMGGCKLRIRGKKNSGVEVQHFRYTDHTPEGEWIGAGWPDYEAMLVRLHWERQQQRRPSRDAAGLALDEFIKRVALWYRLRSVESGEVFSSIKSNNVLKRIAGEVLAAYEQGEAPAIREDIDTVLSEFCNRLSARYGLYDRDMGSRWGGYGYDKTRDVLALQGGGDRDTRLRQLVEWCKENANTIRQQPGEGEVIRSVSLAAANLYENFARKLEAIIGGGGKTTTGEPNHE